jgi:UDP-glucose 4-epimerase
MTIFGDGSQTRAFSYIGDVAPLIARAIDVPAAYNQMFNVGADVGTTVNDLARMLAEAMCKPAQVTHLPPLNELLPAVADHCKVARVFGYRAKWALREGLQRMADWAKRVGPRQPSTFGRIEVDRNLPASWKVE